MRAEQIAQVRSFNRAVTLRVGALDSSYLARGRPLSEARLVFEVGAANGMDVRAIRDRLGLDSGYLSRLLRSLERQGVLEVRKSGTDGRVRQVVLTAKGRTEYEAYDALSDDLATSILSPLSSSQAGRLVDAMGEVERLLRVASATLAEESADTGDARWCLEQYYAELAARFDAGFDPAAGNNFDPAEMAPPKGWFVVARLEGAPAACGALKRLGDGVGEIKRVWTSRSVRGMGVAGRVMDRLEALAREAGFRTLRLDTNRALAEAQDMYRKRGYLEIGRYNDNPYAHHWFEKSL